MIIRTNIVTTQQNKKKKQITPSTNLDGIFLEERQTWKHISSYLKFDSFLVLPNSKRNQIDYVFEMLNALHTDVDMTATYVRVGIILPVSHFLSFDNANVDIYLSSEIPKLPYITI